MGILAENKVRLIAKNKLCNGIKPFLNLNKENLFVVRSLPDHP